MRKIVYFNSGKRKALKVFKNFSFIIAVLLGMVAFKGFVMPARGISVASVCAALCFAAGSLAYLKISLLITKKLYANG
tara:strand:- start:334 stop:567 length:234 start_codon:yes stop_codon:yes gene_type:complete